MKGFTVASPARVFGGDLYRCGTSGCNGQGVGSYGYYQEDADQFAAWGFDAVKVDFCGAGQTWLDQPLRPSDALHAVLAGAGAAPRRDDPERLQLLDAGADQRNGSVIRGLFLGQLLLGAGGRAELADRYGHRIPGNILFPSVLRNLDQDSTPQAEVQARPALGVLSGHWNDPDYLAPGLGMTCTQAQSQFSMWAMVAAPLILGSDPRALSSSTITMLENPRVIAIDQDSLGAQGCRSRSPVPGQVWVKPLANGDRAVAMFNRGSGPLQIATTASAVGLPRARHYTLLNVGPTRPRHDQATSPPTCNRTPSCLPRRGRPGLHRSAPARLRRSEQHAPASRPPNAASDGSRAHALGMPAADGVIAQRPPSGTHRRQGTKVNVVLERLNVAWTAIEASSYALARTAADRHDRE